MKAVIKYTVTFFSPLPEDHSQQVNQLPCLEDSQGTLQGSPADELKLLAM
jgi:hypothetical protein